MDDTANALRSYARDLSNTCEASLLLLKAATEIERLRGRVAKLERRLEIDRVLTVNGDGQRTEVVVPPEKRPDLPDCGATNGLCPICGERLEVGFGLAGGGYGVYEYCASESCNRVVTKTDVQE